MESFKGIVVGGRVMGVYKLYRQSLTCKVSDDGFYCVTYHNGRQSARTYYSKDKDEMNDYVRQALKDGFKRVQ